MVFVRLTTEVACTGPGWCPQDQEGAMACQQTEVLVAKLTAHPWYW